MENLCSQYQEYHSNSGTEITQESLVKQSRKLLTVVKPEERFVHLNIDFYRNVLGKISQNFESNEESIQRITTGFNGLEKYGVNLWKFPWRKEYHTIKLYTAFFKCNIEHQLQDTEVTFEILKSLGYAVREQQEISIKEPVSAGAIWIAFNLFLAQVDLQVIKEIMDHFPNSEFTLKQIVKARSKTLNVEDAIYYLQRKGAKRRKMEQPQGDHALSHGHTKDIHIGRIDVINNLTPDATRSDAVSSADQTSKRPAKRSVLSKGRGDVAGDTDDSSTGSVVDKKHPSVGSRTEYKVSSGNTGRRYFSSMNTEPLGHVSDQDLYGVSPEGSQHYGATQHNVDAHYSTAPPAGSDARYSTAPPADAKVNARYSTAPPAGTSHYPDNTHRYHTSPQVGHAQYYDNTKDRMDAPTAASHSLSHHGTVPPMHSIHQYTNPGYGRFEGYDPSRYGVATQSGTMGVITDANGYQSKVSARTEAQVHGTPSGDARYANIRDTYSSAHQQFGSNNLDTSVSSKDSARRHDHRDARYRETRAPGAEPMEVEQIESSHGHRDDAFSRYNGMAEATFAKATGHSGVTELNATIKHRLTLEPSDDLSGKASQQASSASTEHRRQYETTREVQPSRSLYQNESNFMSSKEVGRKTRSSAADLTSHTAEKGEGIRSSPVPTRRISAQREEIPLQHQPSEAQNPGHSLKNDRQNEVHPNPQAALSQGAKTSKQGSKVDNSICDMCMSQGTSICRFCFRFVCEKCKKIYDTDLCEVTKGQHKFKDLKSIPVQQRKSELSSQNYENVDEGIGNDELDWPCSRCTFLNPSDHKICVMCGATRGVGPVELTQAGSRVCRKCTYHNKEGAKVCDQCLETLDLQNPETSV
ncbi:uncharacterized protein LOC144652250 isoform X2 [Oculina patagonica]